MGDIRGAACPSLFSAGAGLGPTRSAQLTGDNYMEANAS